jgi:PhzF family phenazine biosynthesis protein
MPERAFQQIDVFSQRPGDGNPLAVVLDAQGLSDADMQRFATWANLSETTYLLAHRGGPGRGPTTACASSARAAFAGHPTLGSCHAWLKAGGSPRVPGSIVQECAGGLVRIEQSDGLLALLRPHAAQRPQPALLALVTGALGLRPQQVLAAQVLDNGPRWLALLLPSAELVLGLQPDHARLGDLGRTWAWCTWPPAATPAAPV